MPPPCGSRLVLEIGGGIAGQHKLGTCLTSCPAPSGSFFVTLNVLLVEDEKILRSLMAEAVRSSVMWSTNAPPPIKR